MLCWNEQSMPDEIPAFIINILELVFNGQVILGNKTKDPEYHIN